MSQPYPQQQPYGQPYPPQGYGQPYPGQQQFSGQYPPGQYYQGDVPPPQPGFAPMAPPKYGEQYQGGGYDVGYTSAGGSHNVTVGAPNENEATTWAGFSDKNIRRMFVQKVYSILSIQLFVTFGITALVVLTPSIKNWVQAHAWIYWISYIVFFSLYITLMCCEGPRRNHPTNLILLGVFTLALSFMVAMICSFHKLDSVLIAAGITALCCTAVSVLSCWTKFDFTKFGWALAIAGLALFIMGICTIFIRTKTMFIIYAGIGTVIFMLFLAYDTQMITGGKKYSISPEEYVMASIMLYVDIVYIFLFILQLVSSGRD